MWKPVVVGVFALLALHVRPSAAQALPPEHVQVEAGALDFVEISFVALDRAGRPVSGLGKDDFRLAVDRADIPLESVTGMRDRIDTPLSIVFLTDVSKSMKKMERKRFLAGSRAMLARLRPIDEMMLVSFAEEPKVRCEFTGDADALSAALEAIPAPEGGTNLARALELAIDRLSGRVGLGVVVLYSDGGAPAGAASLTAEPEPADLLRHSRRRAVSLYWIVPHFQGVGAVMRNDGLRNLAARSGGRWILETRGIESALDDVGKELGTRYDASFYVDTSTRVRDSYEIDLRARTPGITVRAPQFVTGSLDRSRIAH